METGGSTRRGGKYGKLRNWHPAHIKPINYSIESKRAIAYRSIDGQTISTFLVEVEAKSHKCRYNLHLWYCEQFYDLLPGQPTTLVQLRMLTDRLGKTIFMPRTRSRFELGQSLWDLSSALQILSITIKYALVMAADGDGGNHLLTSSLTYS